MKLSDLRENFSLLESIAEQRLFIAAYRTKRNKDMEMYQPAKRRASSVTRGTSKPTFEKLGLSEEEAKIAKALGLTPQQVLKMRSN